MDLVSWTFETEPADINKPLLIDATDPSRSLSFIEIRNQVRRLVSGLHAVGIRPGDCVCLSSFNDILYNVLYLGIIGAGARFTGTNPAYKSHEMAHHLRITKATALIVEPKLLSSALAAIKECGIPESRVFVLDIHENNPQPSLASWECLLQYGEKDWVSIDNPSTTVASIASTSGTSGMPKGALLSHSYLVTQAAMRNADTPLPYEVRRLTALPPMHVFATPIVPASIRGGHPTYIMRRFDMQHFIEAIEKFEISETWMPPPVLIGIPQCPLATKDGLRSLRSIWMGGAGVTYANQLPLYALLNPEAKVNQVWGMTECGWVTTTVWPDKQTDDTVGRALPGFELQIIQDDEVTLCRDGEVGNILVKSPHVMLGYISNEAATVESFTPDGWLRTGDVGYREDGRYYIIDRKKELLKVRGWQVSPAEVESVLLQHPEITDAALIGIPTADSEIPRAYIVCVPGSKLTEADVKAFARGLLASYKVPEEIVFNEEIPKNSTGKILRRVLRERVTSDGSEITNVDTATSSSERTSEDIRKEETVQVMVTEKRRASWQKSMSKSPKSFKKVFRAVLSPFKSCFKGN